MADYNSTAVGAGWDTYIDETNPEIKKINTDKDVENVAHTHYIQTKEHLGSYCQECGVFIITSYMDKHAKYHRVSKDDIFIW